ncbi:MAG TPA: hypothetical protein DCO83_16670 [Mucilaginibacter sp.]|jgi:hypothetical protein|nr:hypothetical protein [Mucilaginibacter sp.]
MNLFNQVSERVSEKFADAKLEGTGRLAPRPGYYFIRAVLYETTKLNREVPMAIVNWKANKEDFFIDGLEFKVALRHLSLDPKSNRFVAREDLINKTIFIYGVRMGVEMNYGQPNELVVYDFDIVDEKPSFINAQNAGKVAFLGKAKTLAEVCKNFADNAPYDVALAEEIEATGDSQDYGDEGEQGYDE